VRAQQNIVLIGMPGVGKSTVGVLLAKATSRSFADTDVQIQVGEGRRLQALIDTAGVAAFRALEERYVLRLALRGYVIATGGSVVYSERAMAHLSAAGVVVYLELAFPLLMQRITDLDSRGIVIEQGQSMQGLFQERRPLYRKYAALTIDCASKRADQVVYEIVAALERL